VSESVSAPIAPIAHQIWDMKYRFKTPGGEPVDKSVEDTWHRVATALAAVESDPDTWGRRFREALEGFRVLPAGRILAGAGTDRKVTLFNCFVMGTIADDMGAIFSHLREAALTLQQGGGIGYDFSTLRPKGAPVHGVGADASGPVSFMDVWDAMCRTIMSAGSRRGAMMATLRCDHPDIEQFIDAKREPGRLRMFNLSVLVSDAFMAAVQADAAWDLVFEGTVFRTVRARDLWGRIMRATYDHAEPGVIFIDRVNQRNNLWYCETIQATNPCVTAETWVHTTEGPRQVADLVGRPFTALVEGRPRQSDPEGFFPTGRKPVLALDTVEGWRVRLTADHPVRVATRRTRDGHETEWRPAGDLTAGDLVCLHDHGTDDPRWDGEGTAAEGYLIGLLVGDGTLKTDKAVLSAWPGEQVVNGTRERPGVQAVMAAALEAARSLPHRSDFSGWVEVPGRGEVRMALGAVKTLAARYDMTPGRKTLTDAIERAGPAFQAGVLRGLFDADGSVQGTQEKGVSIRLAQSDADLLRRVQRILARFGVIARLYLNRRIAGSTVLSDGRGGVRAYPTRAQHELIIAGANLPRYLKHIGFHDSEKAARLKAALGAYKRALNRERFVARVARIMPDGDADVFDVRIPGVNAFDGNGLWLHNCGEQPLPPYGTCLLGSVNLARLVADPFTPDARLDTDALADLTATAVRMLDTVIEVSRYPLPEQRHEALTKRRIGLGITGLGDALIQCGARYGSPAAVALTDQWMATLRRAAYAASIDLAREKGPFPLFDRDKYLQGETIRALDDDLRAGIAEHGIRNALITSVAPTGTISLFADNVSSGLEPVFSFTFSRAVLQPDGTRREETVSDYAYRLYRALKGEDAPLTDAFVDAQALTPRDHLVMQAVVQKYIDSAVSKTINVPEDLPFEAFKDVYWQAWESGCKGCTTYRPNPVTGAVLSVSAPGAEPEAPVAEGTPSPDLPPQVLADDRADLATVPGQPHDDHAPLRPGTTDPAAHGDGRVVHLTRPLDRPQVLPGQTYKVRWPESDHAIYITVNDIVGPEGRRRPFEVFINSKNMEHYAWTVALTRMISAVFRRGGDVRFVVEELKAVFDPRGGQWMGGRYVPSLLAAIGEVIERHMVETGFLVAEAEPEAEEPPGDGARAVASDGGRAVASDGAAPAPRPSGLRFCPKCGQPTLMRQEGCDTCAGCGYSKCS